MGLDVNKISNNTKNIVYLILLIGEAAWVVFMVFANQKEIQLTEKRSQKRYEREMKKASDHEKRIREIEAFMNYTKGGKCH